MEMKISSINADEEVKVLSFSSCCLLSAHKRHVWEELMIPQATVKSHSSTTLGSIWQHTDRVDSYCQRRKTQNSLTSSQNEHIYTLSRSTGHYLVVCLKHILTSIEVYEQLPSWSDPPGALRSKMTANGPQTSWLPEAGGWPQIKCDLLLKNKMNDQILMCIQ